MAQKPTALGGVVLAGLSSLSTVLVVNAAQAYPYAYASNQISGLTITTLTGATPGRITPTAYSATISDSSAFGASLSQTFSNGSSTPGTALSISQAFSGLSATPASGYLADGAGSFVGTRANSSISAGNATTGGVAANNVAEGSGDSTSFGNSTANNKATIGLVVIGNGEQVLLSFTDLFRLATSTAGLGETSNASIGDTFSVLDANGLVASFAPSILNQTIGSTNGTSSTDTGELSQAFSFITPTLALGQSYTLSLTSSSAENIFPGSVVVSEPRSSLSILGSALLLLGVLTHRRKANPSIGSAAGLERRPAKAGLCWRAMGSGGAKLDGARAVPGTI
jgi:hypothetical protein